MSMTRFRKRDERGRTGGLTPRTVIPSTSSTSTEGPRASKSCGNTLSFTPSSRERRSRSNSVDPSLKSSCATMTRSTACRSTASARSSPSSRPRTGRPRASAGESERAMIPTELDAVFRMRPDLPGQGAGLLPVADQQHPLPAERRHREPPGKRPKPDDGHGRKAGEPGQVAQIDEAGWSEAVVPVEQDAAEQHAVEDPGEIVDGSVTDPLHVAVVEAVGLEQDDPHGERGEAPQELARVVGGDQQRSARARG